MRRQTKSCPSPHTGFQNESVHIDLSGNPVRVPPVALHGVAHTLSHIFSVFFGVSCQNCATPPRGGVSHLHSLNGQGCCRRSCRSKGVALHGKVAATLLHVGLHFVTLFTTICPQGLPLCSACVAATQEQPRQEANNATSCSRLCHQHGPCQSRCTAPH